MNTDKIKEDINQIMLRYQFEFNTEKTRKEMCYVISRYLGKKILDETTPNMVDKNVFNFVIVLDNIKYPLAYYINNLEILERKLKIQKIKSKIWKI